MAASFNQVTLVGNITRDIEVRHTPSGTAVTDLGLAVNERRKNQSGEWEEVANFFDVTLWGRTAEVAAEYCGKGSSVLISGRLNQDRWQDPQSGQNRSKVKVVCDRLQMLGSPQGGGGHNGNQQQYQAPPQQAAPQQAAPQQVAPQQVAPQQADSDINPENIPF